MEYRSLLHPLGMKKLFPTLLCLAPLLLAAQKSQKVIRYHYKKLKQSEGLLVNGQKEGRWFFWFPSGQLSETAGYHQGQRHGTYTAYEEAALPPDLHDPEQYRKALALQKAAAPVQPAENGRWYMGQKTGRWVYTRKGRRLECSYHNGLEEGMAAEYDDRDSLLSLYTYQKGVRNGPFILNKTNESTMGRYVNGQINGPLLTFRKGVLYSEAWMQDGLMNGYYRVYDASGKKIIVNGYKTRGISDSLWVHVYETETCTTLYHLDRLMSRRCTNAVGIPTNTAHRNNENTLVTTQWYANGRKQQEETRGHFFVINNEWDSSGQLIARDTLWQLPMLHWKKEGSGHDSLYARTAEAPQFKGGYSALEKYFNEHMVFPQYAIDMHIEGRAYAEITIAANGRVKDVSIKRGLDATVEKELVRLLENMPDWLPAQRNGRPESARVLLSFDFLIPGYLLPVLQPRQDP